MCTGTLAHEVYIAKGWVPIGFLALCTVGSHLDVAFADILSSQPQSAVDPAGNAFGAVQPDKITPSDPVHHTPNFFAWTWFDIRRCAPASWPSFQVEAQTVVLDPADAPFEGTHTAALAEHVVMHVGTEGEIPDLVVRRAGERQPVEAILELRQPPGPGGGASQEAL